MSDAARRRVWWLLPMLAAVAVMLPRLWMPAFGLVDDGIMLHHAWSMDRDWRICYRFLQPEGRFFPAYVAWLYALSWIGTTPAPYGLERGGSGRKPSSAPSRGGGSRRSG